MTLQSGTNPDLERRRSTTIAAENTPTPVTPAAVADVGAAATFPATVNAALPVTGTVLFKNFGPYQAQGVTYTLTLSANLTGVSFSNLPAGANATYVSGTGVVTLASMPTTLNPGVIALL